MFPGYISRRQVIGPRRSRSPSVRRAQCSHLFVFGDADRARGVYDNPTGSALRANGIHSRAQQLFLQMGASQDVFRRALDLHRLVARYHPQPCTRIAGVERETEPGRRRYAVSKRKTGVVSRLDRGLTAKCVAVNACILPPLLADQITVVSDITEI